MMEAVHFSDTGILVVTIWRQVPEDSNRRDPKTEGEAALGTTDSLRSGRSGALFNPCLQGLGRAATSALKFPSSCLVEELARSGVPGDL
jgi:hypothetical protein